MKTKHDSVFEGIRKTAHILATPEIDPDAEIVEETNLLFERGPDDFNAKARSRKLDEPGYNRDGSHAARFAILEDPGAIWHDIEGWIGIYSIEEKTGAIWSHARTAAGRRGQLKDRIITPVKVRDNYWGVVLSAWGNRQSIYLHKLYESLWPKLPIDYKWKRNWTGSRVPTPADMMQVPTLKRRKWDKDAEPILYVPPSLRNRNQVRNSSHVGTEEVGND